MKKPIGIILVTVSILMTIIIHLPPVTKLRDYPFTTLEEDYETVSMQLDAINISKSSVDADKKSDLIEQKIYDQIEIARRNYALEWVALIIFAVGVVFLFLKKMAKPAILRHVRKVHVTEVLPGEAYVDEAEFGRRTQDGFTTKEEALHWYDNDPLRKCSYCGSTSVKPVRGQKQDEIQLLTFYKKVPQGTKDLRIIFGTYWFVRPAAELQCENCNQKIFRY